MVFTSLERRQRLSKVKAFETENLYRSYCPAECRISMCTDFGVLVEVPSDSVKNLSSQQDEKGRTWQDFETFSLSEKLENCPGDAVRMMEQLGESVLRFEGCTFGPSNGVGFGSRSFMGKLISHLHLHNPMLTGNRLSLKWTRPGGPFCLSQTDLCLSTSRQWHARRCQRRY